MNCFFLFNTFNSQLTFYFRQQFCSAINSPNRFQQHYSYILKWFRAGELFFAALFTFLQYPFPTWKDLKHAKHRQAERTLRDFSNNARRRQLHSTITFRKNFKFYYISTFLIIKFRSCIPPLKWKQNTDRRFSPLLFLYRTGELNRNNFQEKKAPLKE